MQGPLNEEAWSPCSNGTQVSCVIAILNLELSRVGATSEGDASRQMLDLDNPTLDLCSIARGMGVPAIKVTTADELVAELAKSFATSGPTFIEAMLPKGLG